MRYGMSYKKLFYMCAFVVLLLAQTGGARAEEAAIPDKEYMVPKPPFTEGIYPCSQCHASMPVNTQRRELSFHTEIQLQHATKQRWCLDCHNPTNRDVLRLANGDTVPFEKLYNLCGQCHGTTFRDWKVGLHGKRTGMWNGEKMYRLCVNCHNPHSPRFKQLEPLPPPLKPLETQGMKTKIVEYDGQRVSVPQWSDEMKKKYKEEYKKYLEERH
jgi:hypothetical protein